MENKNNKVSLEALLKFKKAEQPNAQFWDRFDQELKVRALQTCIKKDAWYEVVGSALTEKLLPVASAVALCLLVGVSAYLSYEPQTKEASSTLVTLEESSTKFVEQDYLVAGNEAVSKDYAVTIVSLSNDSNDFSFEEDSISIAIGSTADYSELMASSNTLKNTQVYPQLASYAF
jgi:hypothetical protein